MCAGGGILTSGYYMHVCSTASYHVVASVVINAFCFRSFHVLFLLGVCYKVGNIQEFLNVIIISPNVAVFPDNNNDFGIGYHSTV